MISEVIVFGPKLLRNILDYIIRWYLYVENESNQNRTDNSYVSFGKRSKD